MSDMSSKFCYLLFKDYGGDMFYKQDILLDLKKKLNCSVMTVNTFFSILRKHKIIEVLDDGSMEYRRVRDSCFEEPIRGRLPYLYEIADGFSCDYAQDLLDWQLKESSKKSYNKNKHKRKLYKTKAKILEIEHGDHYSPVKAFVTNSFYTLFSAFTDSVRGIASLPGPSIPRFILNVNRIAAPGSKVLIIESNEKTYKSIKEQINYIRSRKDNNLNYIVGNYDVRNLTQLHTFPFLELDANGAWSTMADFYKNQLKAQAEYQKNNLIKGFIFTISERCKVQEDTNHHLKDLLSILGTIHNGDFIVDSPSRKTVLNTGPWKYLYKYNNFDFEYSGRLLKLFLYRYAQTNHQMVTGMLVYK